MLIEIIDFYPGMHRIISTGLSFKQYKKFIEKMEELSDFKFTLPKSGN